MPTIMDFLSNPIDPYAAADVHERQLLQWKAANAALTAAAEALNTGDTEPAIAMALTGLLALELSKT